MSEGINRATEASLWGEIADSFTRKDSLVLSLVGLIAVLFSWAAAPDTKIPLWSLWVALIISAVIIWTLIDTCKKLHRRELRVLPRVITAIRDDPTSRYPVLLLQPSELFGPNTQVSIFASGLHGFERLVGHGFVRTVQQDRNIQVEITEWAEAHAQVIKDAEGQNAVVLSSLIVKPSVAGRSNLQRDFEWLSFVTAAIKGQGEADVKSQ